LDTAPPPRTRWTASTVFFLTVLVGVGIAGGVFVATSHPSLPSPAQTSAPGPYAAALNQTSTESEATPPAGAATNVPPLPAALVGAVPEVDVEYDNMPFTGEQGSYCWAGGATTVQSDTPVAPTCRAVTPPIQMSGLPTIAVYPNASVGFQFPEDVYMGLGGGSAVNMSGLAIDATLLQSGSMTPIKSSTSAISGFTLGHLPTGDYVLMTNATWGRSYTVDYFGIQQIDSVRFSEGSIAISVGEPQVERQSISGGASGSEMTESGPVLETWPLTLTSSSVVTNVNLASISVIKGDWIRFLPSVLPEVGPNGTEAQMLLAGAVRPFVNNDESNVTMIIQATGSDGSNGEVGLPLEGPGGSVVLHSLVSGQQFLTPTWSVTTGQTNFVVVSLIYDPSGGASNQTLPVNVTIDGLYQASGAVVPLPSWLQLSVPSTSDDLSIVPFQPLQFGIDTSSATSAPIGGYTVVVGIQVGGTSISLFAPVEVVGPIYMGG